MATSNFKLITAIGSVRVVQSTDSVSSVIFSKVSYPYYAYESTFSYIDGSDPMNVDGVGDMETASGGTPNITAAGWSVFDLEMFDAGIITGYPDSIFFVEFITGSEGDIDPWTGYPPWYPWMSHS